MPPEFLFVIGFLGWRGWFGFAFFGSRFRIGGFLCRLRIGFCVGGLLILVRVFGVSSWHDRWFMVNG